MAGVEIYQQEELHELVIQCSDHLKEDEVDEEEDEPWPTEPEEVVTEPNHWGALDHVSSLLNSESHLSDDYLELCPHQ